MGPSAYPAEYRSLTRQMSCNPSQGAAVPNTLGSTTADSTDKGAVPAPR